MSRFLCQFSCGAASAVATKLTLAQSWPKSATFPDGHPCKEKCDGLCGETCRRQADPKQVLIVNAFVAEEHPDNRRFLSDCERWFDHPITVLRDEKYGASVREVWKRKRYIIGQQGAPCRVAIKTALLDAIALPDDVMVLGYTVEEAKRLDQFIDANNSRRVIAPLIERGLTKADCLAIIERAGIELPIAQLRPAHPEPQRSSGANRGFGQFGNRTHKASQFAVQEQ